MDYAKLRVLFLALEFPRWQQARHWSYGAQLGFEEGLQACGVKFLTVTTPWLSRVQEICRGQKFDQVWFEIVHHTFDDGLLDWIAGVAPVRVGFLGESLEYTPEECLIDPRLAARKRLVEDRLKYVTHAVAVDEHDVREINMRGLASAMWLVSAVPERFVRERSAAPALGAAAFSGALYGERASWLERPELKGLLIKQPSPEQGTPYPLLFDALHYAVPLYLRRAAVAEKAALGAYLCALRRIRRRCFSRWLRAMWIGSAVINLPACVKAYAGRVVEAMAAGRPVISWEIPNRPRTKALFEDGKEILLYPKDSPGQLAAHVQRIQAEPDFARRLVAAASARLRRFHTTEKRVQQVLDWLDTGALPTYE